MKNTLAWLFKIFLHSNLSLTMRHNCIHFCHILRKEAEKCNIRKQSAVKVREPLRFVAGAIFKIFNSFSTKKCNPPSYVLIGIVQPKQMGLIGNVQPKQMGLTKISSAPQIINSRPLIGLVTFLKVLSRPLQTLNFLLLENWTGQNGSTYSLCVSVTSLQHLLHTQWAN